MTGRRVPLTVIGGYLGVGKTTLVNRLLSATNGTRYAVLVNDLGAVNVDAELLESTGADRIVLSNGCLCCSLADGLTEVMFDLADRTDEFDHVVIELSGVGLPGPVARWGRAPGFVPGTTLVLAAADSVVDRLADPLVGDTVRRQLADADLVVLTRTDLVDTAGAAVARAAIATTTDAPIAAGSSAELPWSAIVEAAPPGVGAGSEVSDHVPAGPGFTTRAIDVSGAGIDDVRAWLEVRPADVWRAKGVVGAAEGSHIVQVVGRRIEISTAPESAATTPLVVIAPDEVGDALDQWIDRWTAGR